MPVWCGYHSHPKTPKSSPEPSVIDLLSTQFSRTVAVPAGYVPAQMVTSCPGAVGEVAPMSQSRSGAADGAGEDLVSLPVGQPKK